MYLATLPGILKIIILIFGFITVNIGTNAVINSPVYQAYRAAYLQELERIEPEARLQESECTYIESEVKKADDKLKKKVTEYRKLKKDIEKLEIELEKYENNTSEKNYTNAELLVMQAEYIKQKNDQIAVFNQIPKLESDLDIREYSRRKACDPYPPWVLHEVLFVVFAIGTISVEFFSLIGGIMMPELYLNDKVFRRMDGIFQFIMGMVIFAGSICLLSGLTANLDDDGFNKRYPEESQIHWIADEVIFDLHHKERQLDFYYRMAKNELDKPARKRRPFIKLDEFTATGAYKSSNALTQEFERQKLVIAIQIRQIKRTFGYNDKIAASACGFLTSLLFVFSSGLIGRGIISIRIR